MKSKRKRHQPEFKARVALEAIKGIKTIQEVSKEFEVHPVQVSDWKKKMIEGAANVFASAKNKSTEAAFESKRPRLHHWKVIADAAVVG